jgi:hypothetical protein
MNLLRTPPVSPRFETHKDVRHDSLNFERRGERHSQLDITDQPMVQIYYYLAHAAKSLVTRSN